LAAGVRTRSRTLAAALLLAPFLASIVVVAVVLVSCAVNEPVGGNVAPAASVGPTRTVSPAVLQTRLELVRVLAAHSLVLADTQVPIRPAEAPLLADAPRAVYQVLLPKDPDRGYIIVYEFPDPARATEAATQQQSYLATGPARIQRTSGTVTVIRQVGSTLVYYDWLPAGAKDPSAEGIQPALESLGVAFPIAG
jgi:hypothetical protein